MKNDRLKKNDELVNIVNFFINEYKISNNRNFFISEHELSSYDNNEIIDSLKYVYIHIQDYQNDTPYVKINGNRELLRARTGGYNIYYEVDKGDTIRIPNYLEWEKVEPEIRDEILKIFDYIELQCLYNLKDKKIEL